jgi:hypothetical protein
MILFGNDVLVVAVEMNSYWIRVSPNLHKTREIWTQKESPTGRQADWCGHDLDDEECWDCWQLLK